MMPALKADDESQSIQDWKLLLKELNKIEKIVTNTTVLQFRKGCSVTEEFKSSKGEILSHRFNCLGNKISVVYQGTFAIVFLEDKQEVRVIDLSLAKNEMSIKDFIVHLFIKDGVGIASPLGSAFSPQILNSTTALVTKNTVFHTFDWIRKHNPKQPVVKFSMNEFSSQYRDADIASGEGVGKLSVVFEDKKIKIAPRHSNTNRVRAISLSLMPILGGYFSNFYLHVERGEMFNAGKMLKLIDDLINAHPEELGFLKGHTLEDRDHANLFWSEIATTAGVNPKELSKNLEKAQGQKIQNKISSSETFYKDIHDTDVDIKKRMMEEELSKGMDRVGKMSYAAKKFITQDDSHYTIGDVYEDYLDKYARGPLERINPLFNLLSAGKLFRNEAVHAGYLAETYYRQNQGDLYDKAVAMPADGKEFLPTFKTAKDSIRNAQGVFAKNLCPSFDKSLDLSDNEQMKLKEIQNYIDGLTSLFSLQQKRLIGSKDSGIAEDYGQAMEALSGSPNYNKGMEYLGRGLRKLEMGATAILSLQRSLRGLSSTSPKFQIEHLRLMKLISEWGQWNGLIRQQMDKVMGQNLNLALEGKKPTALPADLAYLYHKDPHSLDLSPGGPKESYLELNRWFTESHTLSNQVSKSLENGKVEFAPPAALVDGAYSPNYKVFEKVADNSNLMKESYTTNFSVNDYQQFQQNAENVYMQSRSKDKSKN